MIPSIFSLPGTIPPIFASGLASHAAAATARGSSRYISVPEIVSFGHVIPPELDRLRRLEILHLHNNSIGGEIPANLSRCSKLICFDVSYNKLVGQLPVEFGYSLLKLQKFVATINNFHGSIPDTFGKLTNLQAMLFQILSFFGIESNQFTGSIPVSISNNSNLFNLAIALNEITGGVPALDKLHKLQCLVEIDLPYNNYGGMLTETIGNLSTNLQNMDLDQNQILGSIPSGIGNLINLERLWLSENQFTGNIPFDIS
ncbi:hypothetical protein ACSBR2_007768 [Camellia fascicularis]